MANGVHVWQTCPREMRRGVLSGLRAPLVIVGPMLLVYFIAAVNARHASAVNVSTGPSRSVVSRTSTACAEATSTHSPPLSPE